MSVRALDKNGDWTFGSGFNNYKTQNAEVQQDIQTRLSSFLGDCFFDQGAGIDWFNFLSGKNPTGLNLAVSAVILNTPGVLNLTQLSLNLNDVTRNIVITYTVNTVYTGTAPVAGTVNKVPNYILTEAGDILDTESGLGIITE